MAGLKYAFVYYQGPVGVFTRSKITSEFTAPRDLQIGDIDGDGRPDLVIGGHARGGQDTSTVAWYHNPGGGIDGNGQPWAMEVLDGETAGASAVSLADMDGNGHLDVVAAFFDAKELRTFLNEGAGSFSTPQPAKAIIGGVGWAIAVLAVDVTGDGGPDTIYASVSDRYDACLACMSPPSSSLYFWYKSQCSSMVALNQATQPIRSIIPHSLGSPPAFQSPDRARSLRPSSQDNLLDAQQLRPCRHPTGVHGQRLRPHQPSVCQGFQARVHGLAA